MLCPSFISLSLGEIARGWASDKKERPAIWAIRPCRSSWPVPATSGLLDCHSMVAFPSVSFTTYLFHSSISPLVNRSLNKMFSIIAGYFYPLYQS